MKPLVELISAWQTFADSHAGASVESFCHHYLASKNRHRGKNSGWGKDAELSKLIGRTNSLLKTNLKLALKQGPDIELEWFYILDTVITHQEIRKTDVVGFRLLLEPTTGIDIMNRMIKSGMISERVDPSDKRARLVKATAKGIKMYKELNTILDEVTSTFFASVSKEHKAIMTLALDKLTTEQGERIIENRIQGRK